MSLPSTYDAWRTASPDDDGPDFEDAMSDTEITNVLAEAGVDDSLLEAAVYAVRNLDFGYLVRQWERLGVPVVQAHVECAIECAKQEAGEARYEAMQDERMFG